MKAKCAE